MSTFRIFPEKENTIYSGKFERLNTSDTPVFDLIYGGSGTRNSIGRHLVKFNLTELQNRLNSFEINPNLVTSYRLVYKNAIPSDKQLEPEFEFDKLDKSIASSFDLVFFPINHDFHKGRGIDFETSNIVLKQHGQTVLSGVSNWLSATTLVSWDSPGIYSDITASTSNYSIQSFDTGSEDIYADVTNIVKNWLSGGSINNGIGIAYTKPFESQTGNTRFLSSFYTNKTNSAFKPYLEVNYNQTIKDERNNVYTNKSSKVFIYTFSGNSPVNYFSAGTITIKNSANAIVASGITPTHFSKGVYYYDTNKIFSAATKGQKFKETLNNVTFDSDYGDLQNLENTIVIKDNFFKTNLTEINDYVVDTFGISNNQTLISGEIYRIYALIRTNYSQNHPESDVDLEFRLTIGNFNEIITWTKSNSAIIDGCLKNFFDIDTSWLLSSQNYQITLRINEMGTKRILPEVINFKIQNNINPIKQ